jgi:hypothetical protein
MNGDSWLYQPAGDRISIQRGHPAPPVSDECSDCLSEPRSEQGEWIA